MKEAGKLQGYFPPRKQQGKLPISRNASHYRRRKGNKLNVGKHAIKKPEKAGN